MTRNAKSSRAFFDVGRALTNASSLLEHAQKLGSKVLAYFHCFAPGRAGDVATTLDSMTLDDAATLDSATAAVDNPSPEAQILAEIRAAVAAQLQRPLRPGEEQLEFSALGLDSITLLELGAKLEQRYAVDLTDFAAYEHPTPVALAAHVAALLALPKAATSAAGTAPVPARAPEPSRATPPVSPSSANNSFELPFWPVRGST
jgi:acyl carrier protein